MQITLRSHMIAGVAALGATAIAITPIIQPDLLPSVQRAAASIELSSFDSPVTAISQVVEDINTNILSNAVFGAPWTNDPAFPLLYLGIIPDFLDLPLPALTTFGTNLSGYGWAGVRGVGDLSAKVLQAAWNTPLAVIDAAQKLFQGDTQGAVDVLKADILLPLQLGINSLLNSGDYILSNVVENIGIVAAGILPAVQNLVGTTLSGAAYIGAGAIKTVQDSVDALTQGDYETAWNIAVEGFLGREGTFGSLEKLTLGPGIIVGGGAIPSYRTVVNSIAQSFPFNPPYDPTQGPFQPASAAVKPSSKSQAASVAATPRESSPAVENTAGDNTAGPSAEDDAPTSTAASDGTDGSDNAGAPHKRSTSRKSGPGAGKSDAASKSQAKHRAAR